MTRYAARGPGPVLSQQHHSYRCLTGTHSLTSRRLLNAVNVTSSSTYTQAGRQAGRHTTTRTQGMLVYGNGGPAGESIKKHTAFLFTRNLITLERFPSLQRHLWRLAVPYITVVPPACGEEDVCVFVRVCLALHSCYC